MSSLMTKPISDQSINGYKFPEICADDMNFYVKIEERLLNTNKFKFSYNTYDLAIYLS